MLQEVQESCGSIHVYSKDLEHIMRYYKYAKAKYPNIEFVQVPHYALFYDIKTDIWE